MIATVTLNPSLDYLIQMKEFRRGTVNRSESEQIFPGGKGINVGLMLHRLGLDVCCLCFAAGFTGDEIVRRIESEGCRTNFILLSDGLSRINLKLKAKEESEINGGGPVVKEEEAQLLFSQLEALKSGDVVVFAGSVPNSLPQNVYELWIEKLSDKRLRIVVDTTGDSLMRVLPFHPFLVKPNHYELGELFHQTLHSTEEIVEAARKVQQLGAQNVLVSCAGEGAVLLDETGALSIAKPPAGKLVNSVGAGDSMVAGFLAEFQKSGRYDYALKFGIAAGSATAFSEWLGSKEQVLTLYQQL